MKNVIILIADDDPGICFVYRRMLEQLGCQFRVANTLATAKEMMCSSPKAPDIVFLDLHFPDAAPDTTLTAIADLRKCNPRAAIVVMTGMVDEKIAQMQTALGTADAFRRKMELRKPEDFLTVIEEAVQAGEKRGLEPYEVTTKILQRCQELRNESNALVNERQTA